MLNLDSSLAFALIAASSLGIAACSGSDSSGGGPGGFGGGSGSVPSGGPPAVFSPYCTGKLKVATDLMKADTAGAWMGDGSLVAPAGTTFLVGASFSQWDGYLVLTNGVPAQLSSDFQTGLVKDTDFTSDCATDDKLSAGIHVLMGDSTFHAKEDLSDEPCTLPSGTTLTSFSFLNSGTVATVGADEIKTTCGWDTSYSDDIHYAELILK